MKDFIGAVIGIILGVLIALWVDANVYPIFDLLK